MRSRCVLGIALGAAAAAICAPASARAPSGDPEPLVTPSDADDWIFLFKLNAAAFPTSQTSTCLFGGSPPTKKASVSQAYTFARSSFSALVEGSGLLGTSPADPLGATFASIYARHLNYIVWNDQFYGHPKWSGCSNNCASPWGHTKGLIAWDDAGRGIVLQVTTPSWPGAASNVHPRAGAGNTLGCITKPNNVRFSQHFFALKLTPSDTAAVLDALANASAATDITNPQLAKIGGPQSLQQRARMLGVKSSSTELQDVVLSSGVRMISKPSRLHVPPWQMVSARLGGLPLRTATWWAAPRIPTTEAGRTIICWRDDLGQPGRVEIALDGKWKDKSISLKGAGNHAKLGVSLDDHRPLVIFGDLNQQGRLTNKCDASQNGRGGLFFILEDKELHSHMRPLLDGATAPTTIPEPVRRRRTNR